MTNTSRLRELIAMLAKGEEDGARVEMVAVLHDAADEIDAGRIERLVQYRCAAMQGLLACSEECGEQDGYSPGDYAKDAEIYAQAMLAAERAPEAK